MGAVQLSESFFINLEAGDIFVYKYRDDFITIHEIKDTIPPLDQYVVEIISFYNKRHFILKRDNGYYWWEEVRY